MATVTLQRVRPFQEIQNGVLFGPVTNNLYNINGLGQVTVDLLDQANLLTQGWLPAFGGSSGGGGGGGGGGGVALGNPLFENVAAAQAAVIPDTINTIQIMGYSTPGDGGGGVYGRVSSLPSAYVGLGAFEVTPPIPPSITSGGLPVLVFSTTFHNWTFASNHYGVTSSPIVAGCLTIMVATDVDAWTLSPQNNPPPQFTDSAGNIYLLAPGSYAFSLGNRRSVAIYYCVNPVAVSAGASFNIYAVDPPNNQLVSIDVYCVPGFTGAVLDHAVTQVVDAGSAGGVTLSTGPLAASPELLVGVTHIGGNPAVQTGGTFSYSPQAGWVDLAPPKLGRNPISCTIVISKSPVTYAPTWTGTVATTSAVAMFKSTNAGVPQPALDPSYFTLMPAWPVHTAQYGIDPKSPDNRAPFINFGKWLASIAPPSGTSDGRGIIDSGVATISISPSAGAPAIVSLALPPYATGNGMQHTLRNGQAISFNTTGQLPAPIVPGQKYYVPYSSVTGAVFSGGSIVSPGTIQLSNTSIFVREDGSQTSPKGTAISTFGATQSGVHSYTTYGENWTDFVVDPGIYHSTQGTAPGQGRGLKRWRMRGPGARFQSGVFIQGTPWNDVNANTDSSTVVYSAKFKTTQSDTNGLNPDHIILFNPAEVSNFYVNSWVLLMALELQGSTTANWNQYYFEFAKIRSIDASTGTITFYDKLQYNYRSTYPRFAPIIGGWPGTSIGPATIVQLSDTFDQEIEIHGLTFTGPFEMNFLGVLSLKMVDCYIDGWGFKTGPFPSTMKTFVMERCVCENFQSEIDKMIDTQHYLDCVFDKNSNLIVQSSSTNRVLIERCKMHGGMPGTFKDLTVRDSFTTTLTFGTVFGGCERVLLENTHIENVNSANGGSVITTVADTVFSNGTIKVLVGTTVPAINATWNGPDVVPATCPILWSPPGTKVMIASNSTNSGAPGIGGPVPTAGTASGMLKAFTVLDTYTDSTGNFCVDTSLTEMPATNIQLTGSIAAGSNTLHVTLISPAGALPLNGMLISGGDLPPGTTITNAIGAPNTATPVNTGDMLLSNPSAAGQPAGTVFTVRDAFRFLQHPCPRLTVRNCTGGRWATDWTGAPADIPIDSYFKRVFAGFPVRSLGSRAQSVPLAGNLMTWTIDVRKPYTGASAFICTIAMLGWANASGNYYPTWVQQTINLKTVGIRTITAAATTGGVSGDTLSAVPFWLTGEQWISTGIPDGSGWGSGTADSGATLSMMPKVIMTAQTDQDIDYGSIVISTPKSGLDIISDTATSAGTDTAPVAFVASTYYGADGDSITAGAGVAGYPALYGVGSGIKMANLATGGASLSTIQGRQSTLDHIISFKRAGDKYVLSVMIGTNDACFGYTGGTRTAFLTQLAAYCDHNRSAGWYVIVCTQISRGAPATVSGPGTGGGTPDSELIPINTELRLWATSGSIVSGKHADAICDFAGNAAFLPGGTVYNNTTNYMTDKTHPTAAGENLLYTIIKPIIDGAVATANSPFDPASKGTLAVLANSNFDVTAPTGSTFYSARGSTGHSTGKWYFEFKIISAAASSVFCGLADATTPGGSGMDGFAGFPNESMTRDDGFGFASGFGAFAGALGTMTAGTVIGFAVDFGAKTFIATNNNVVVGTTGTWSASYTLYPCCAISGGGSNQVRLVTGVTTYPPPSGYSAWG